MRVVLTIIRRRFRLFGYSIAVVSVCYLLLSFSHPDYIIALVNIANIEGQTSARAMDGTFLKGEAYKDFYYLAHLNADAAPVLVPYLAESGYETVRMDRDAVIVYLNGGLQMV